MDYERKYKETLEKAKEFYTLCKKCGAKDTVDFLKDSFPELKESEDEKIRKEILQSIRDNMVVIHKDKCIAWLEKQEGCEYIKKDWLEHIKQSWYKEGFIDGKYSGGTSKEWTINDAAIFKEIIDFLENGTAKLQHDLTKYANWLKIQFTPIEKQGKQFSVDKLESKFKVGNWITNGDYTWKIIEVKPLDYILQSQDGNIVDDTISHVDGQFHSFTIEDAKDGDVLASNRSIFIFSQEYIAGKPEAHCGIMNGLFLVKPEGCWTNEECYPATNEQRDTLMKAMADAGYTFDFEKKELKKVEQKPAWSEEGMNKPNGGIVMEDFNDGNGFYKVNLAYLNEEQVEQIEELVKRWGLQPKRDEDESIISDLLDYFDEDKCLKHEVNDIIKWLKTIKPQQKGWGENEIKMLDNLITYLDGRKDLLEEIKSTYIGWLKSLKERYTWKPSDEQMRALHDLNLTGNISYAGQGQVLIELYNDLKKLTE